MAVDNLSGQGAAWGSIAGTLADQTDLSVALAAKLTTPGAWTAYTPTVTGWTAGTGATIDGAYSQTGKIVHFRCRLVLGTGFAISGALNLSLPVTAATNASVQSNTWALFTDAGTAGYAAFANITTTVARARIIGTNGLVADATSTTPFTWVAGDSVTIAGTYEAA